MRSCRRRPCGRYTSRSCCSCASSSSRSRRAVAIVVYALQGGDDFTDRNTSPNDWDIAFGIALIVLVLEAMRRSTGWVMPVVTLGFIVYALIGPWLPAPWTHKGYEI